MKSDRTEAEFEKRNAEKVLPRGLEQVSHLFLSQSNFNGDVVPVPPDNSLNKTSGQEDEHSLTVVSRRFLGRERLLSLLGEQPAALEEGLKLIDRNVPCESAGSMDLLAVDCTNQLSIIDLEISPNDALLLRGLGHYDWIIRNRSIVNRMYREPAIDFSLQPRLILLAPEFSALFRSVVRLIAVPRIHCLKYHVVGMAGDASVFFERI